MVNHTASTPEMLASAPAIGNDRGTPLHKQLSQGPPDIGSDVNRHPHDAPTPTGAASDDKSKEVKKESAALPPNTKGLHTVFIHKLYNMLEDEELKHLIWWTQSNESFVIVPGEEFSRALSQYFKHTNVASFVRQLNMYGFHKVSDLTTVQADASDVPTWEFRHSSGSFRKGDIDSLKQIKRRSSKHASGKTSHIDGGLLSDTEVSSERSNSVTEYPPELNPVDPMLNVRLAELGHNLGALRHEHARLQLRYDTAISDMRKTNLDMVYLLDIMQKLINSSASDQDNQRERDALASPKPHQITTLNPDDMASPGSAVKPPQQQVPQVYTLQDVERDIARFRASIIQRAASKDQFDQFSVPFAPSYQMDQIPRSNHFPPQHMQMPSGNQSPADTTSMNPDSSRYPNPYPYPYPPQFQQFPPPPPQQGQQQVHPGMPQQNPGFPQVHDQQIVHDPFRSDRKSSRSSNRSRNMSILCDPLQPSTNPTIVSPASSGHAHRGSINGVPGDPNGYFPDYKSLHQQPGAPRSHTPEPQQMAYKMSPVMPPGRHDQRAGSFPGIAPVIQNALRGEGLIRKRQGSNDVMEMRGMDNPPRSVPDDGFNAPHMPRKSLSATNIADAKAMPPNSGVYALLNPTDRRDSMSAQQQTKKPRNA